MSIKPDDLGGGNPEPPEPEIKLDPFDSVLSRAIRCGDALREQELLVLRLRDTNAKLLEACKKALAELAEKPDEDVPLAARMHQARRYLKAAIAEAKGNP